MSHSNDNRVLSGGASSTRRLSPASACHRCSPPSFNCATTCSPSRSRKAGQALETYAQSLSYAPGAGSVAMTRRPNEGGEGRHGRRASQLHVRDRSIESGAFAEARRKELVLPRNETRSKLCENLARESGATWSGSLWKDSH